MVLLWWIFGLALTFALPVKAQTTTRALPVAGGTASFVVGGWNISLSGCALKVSGVQQADCTSEQVTASIVNNNLQLVFQGQNGTNLLSAVACGSACASGLSDLSLTETVVAPGSNVVSAVILDLTGSTPNSVALEGLLVSAGQIQQFVAGGTNTTTNLNNVPAQRWQNLVPLNSVVIGSDMKANGSSGTFSLNGDRLVLSSATQTFMAPEPSTLPVMAGCLLAIGLVRSRAVGRR